MSRILVIYGTSEGHTAKIATVIGDTLVAQGCDASVIKAGTADLPLDHVDGVIVAASIHAGRYQKSVRNFVRAHAPLIASKPNAFVSVCLAVLNEEQPAAATALREAVERLTTETGWRPSTTKHVAGALPYTRYSFFTRWLMKRIVAKAGGDTDTSRDYVYTDWDAVKAFAVEFGRSLKLAA